MPDISTLSSRASEDNHDFDSGKLHAYKTEVPDESVLKGKLQDFVTDLSSFEAAHASRDLTEEALASMDATCQHHVDWMYAILRRYREFAVLLRCELRENLNQAEQYELHKTVHQKLDRVQVGLKLAERFAHVMDWKLNGIAETDEKGNLKYEVSDPGVEVLGR